MAQWYAAGYNNPKFMSGDGRARILVDKVAVTTALAAGDVLNYKVPAGFTVTDVEVRPGDLDSDASPAITYKAGYAEVDGDGSLTADDDYYCGVSVGTGMQTGTANRLNFVPIKFNEDTKLTLTIGTVADTPVAGDVWVIVHGNCDGVT